jgi:hypothetical protein
MNLKSQIADLRLRSKVPRHRASDLLILQR